MSNNIMALVLLAILATWMTFVGGCDKKDEALFVYSGKGLKKPMEEIKVDFEKKYNVNINIIYEGSQTLLKTIEETKRGDIFIPGSNHYIKSVGSLVSSSQYVALHTPVVGVLKNTSSIQSFNDLAKPGVRLTIGNPDMCAIGRASDKIIAKSELRESISKNTVIKSATVNALLNLLIKGDVDAAIIWNDMLRWPKSKDLRAIEIPSDINEIEEIHVAVLSVSENKDLAELFADFVASAGKAIFHRYGFGEK